MAELQGASSGLNDAGATILPKPSGFKCRTVAGRRVNAAPAVLLLVTAKTRCRKALD